MITERTAYFAKPGRVADVIATRRRACAVRVAIGLPAGRIQLAAAEAEDQPDVVWECNFADSATHEADLAARAASPDFTAVRVDMNAAIRLFSRQVFTADETLLPNGMAWRSLEGVKVVPREITVHSAGRDLKAYLFLPPGPGPHPLMICNHGSGIDQGSLDVSRPGTAALLMSWGIASLLLHRHGYGNSPGPTWRAEASAAPGTPEYDAQLSGRLDRESDDVLAALDVALTMPEIRPDHIGVMGSSFGGTNTLFAASKTSRFRCAVEFAGAAMNWEKAPGLAQQMTEAAHRLTQPVFFIQAENDYSTGPTRDLTAALAPTGKIMWSKIYPAFGINPNEGHLFESQGRMLWADDVRRFLERYL
jgi:dienelactone hydrolase